MRSLGSELRSLGGGQFWSGRDGQSRSRGGGQFRSQGSRDGGGTRSLPGPAFPLLAPWQSTLGLG